MGLTDPVRTNAERDPNYRPYCLRCRGLVRMGRIADFFWRCDKCGAEHDARDTAPATWDTVQQAALFDPWLYRMVTLVERGDLTREEALIQTVLALAQINRDSMARNVARAMLGFPF